MRNGLHALVLAAALAVGAAVSGARAASPPPPPEAGTPVRVILVRPEGAQIEGTLLSLSEDSVVVRTPGDVAGIATTSIERLEVHGSRTRMHSGAAWGAGFGCATGLLLGLIGLIDSSGDSAFDVSAWIVPSMGGLCLATGALIGTLIGAIPVEGWVEVPLVRNADTSRTQGASPQIGLEFRFSF